jgi:hypothetical protein
MSTKGTAAVVFCLDASASMGSCIEGVKSHIAGFVEELSEVDKSEYEVMAGIGKPVSVPQTSQQSAEPAVRRELYGQSSW